MGFGIGSKSRPRRAATGRRIAPGPGALSVALIVSLTMSAVVILLHEWYPSRAFTFLYLPMVAVLAFLGGRGAGLLSTLISLLGAWYVLLGPARQTTVDTGLAIFAVLFAASTAGLSEAMVRLRRRTQVSRNLAAIVESSDDAIFSKSLDATILTWNAGAERMYGYSAAEAIGRPVAMLAVPDGVDEIPGIMERLARGEQIERYERVRRTKGGTLIDVSLTISPIRDEAGRVIAASTIARDISERRRIEREQQFVIEAGDLFASSLSVESLLQSLAALVVPRLADWCSIDMVDDAGEPQSVTVVHRDPAKVALARQLQDRVAADPRAQEGRRRIIETGRPELIAEIPDELLVQSITDPDVLAVLRALGLRSSLTVPLTARGRVVGALNMVTAESGRRYSPNDLAFAEQIAHRAALAVDNARLHQQEASARQTAEQVARRIGRLQAFTAALSEALTPEQVGDLTLRQIAGELGAGAAALSLVGDDTEKLALVAAMGYAPELEERWWREPERILPLVEAMRTEQVVWFPSWEAFRTRHHEAEPPTDPVRRGARAAVPLMLHGRAIGAMYMNFVEERRFTPEELQRGAVHGSPGARRRDAPGARRRRPGRRVLLRQPGGARAAPRAAAPRGFPVPARRRGAGRINHPPADRGGRAWDGAAAVQHGR